LLAAFVPALPPNPAADETNLMKLHLVRFVVQPAKMWCSENETTQMNQQNFIIPLIKYKKAN
jgi:hypothetical protein